MTTQYVGNDATILVLVPLGSVVEEPRKSEIAGSSLRQSAGSPPFRRGIHENMFKERLWTMRQYAGFSNPQKSNERFRELLSNGQTGLSVAFDLPTQLGLDSDNTLSKGEVGRVGVPIDSIHDMRQLFDEIDLANVSTSMTINAPATTLLALYVAVADERGIDREAIKGTVQNDILKEYIARGLYIFPPEQSIRLTTDLMKWCKDNAPNWNTLSVSGYHLREAGCTAPQEIALTLSNALFYVRSAIDSGLKIDDFAPRISFFFASHNNIIEEICKFRAARELWYELITSEFTPRNIKSSQLRFHTQTSGVTLTAQQPLNNTIRVAFQALSAVLGGTQSLHTNGFDEALGLPTEESAKLALRTQQIIAFETGVADYVDPMGGSYIIEELTDKLIDESTQIIKSIEDIGGVLPGIKSGMQQRMIHESAWEHLSDVESGEEIIIGVNSKTEEQQIEDEGMVLDSDGEDEMVSNLTEVKARRNNSEVSRLLGRLEEACKSGDNVMEPLIEALKAEATVGEVNDVFRKLFGTWMSPSGV